MTDKTTDPRLSGLESEREAFERVASDNGKWPKAIERDAKGNYLLLTTATGWMWWREARTTLYATPAARDVLAERARQISIEGWTPEGDDAYNRGVLAEAAGIYALHAFDPRRVKEVPEGWPWDDAWWKPSKTPRRNLEKAGALILAEIERIDRVCTLEHKT